MMKMLFKIILLSLLLSLIGCSSRENLTNYHIEWEPETLNGSAPFSMFDNPQKIQGELSVIAFESGIEKFSDDKGIVNFSFKIGDTEFLLDKGKSNIFFETINGSANELVIIIACEKDSSWSLLSLEILRSVSGHYYFKSPPVAIKKYSSDNTQEIILDGKVSIKKTSRLTAQGSNEN